MSPVDRDSVMARLLRIVRAGTISPGTVYERSPAAYNQISEAIRAKWIEKDADGDLLLTPAGRAVCPCANPLAETTHRPAAVPQKRVAATTKEVTMKPHANSIQARVLDAIRAAGRDGISRQELLQKLPDLTDVRIDGAMSVLVREGDAHRPRYGHICIGRAPSSETRAVKASAAPSVRELLAQNAEKREAREATVSAIAEPAPASETADAPDAFTDDPVVDRAVDVARWQEEFIAPPLGNHIGGGRYYLAEPLILIGSDRQLRIREGGAELILTREQTAELAQLMAAVPVTTERRAA